MQDLYSMPLGFYEHLPHVWTFLLLVVRYSALILLMPGLSGGPRGMAIRMPAILVLAMVSMMSGPIAALPKDFAIMAAQMMSEYFFGFMLGFAPAMISAGIQMAAQLSTGTMGLGAAQLVDPTLGVSVSSLGRILDGALMSIFLAIGGHYAVIYTAAGMGGSIVPGSYIISAQSIDMAINQTGDIFLMGVMLSAPVIVALLLTQFVMGLISKAVPQVNIFIVSFPLTIGIGLVLTILSVPEMYVYSEKKFSLIEQQVFSVSESTTKVKDPEPPTKL